MAAPRDGCPEVVIETFGVAADTACAVVYCETGGTWRNDLIGGAGEVSMWQIHPVHFGTYSRQLLIDDPEYATQVAYQMSNGGQSFRAWTCA